MILQLLLLLAAARASQAEFKECPGDSVCLYHARCLEKENDDVILKTTTPGDFTEWEKKYCQKQLLATAELFIRPISDKKWNVTLAYNKKSVEISFGHNMYIILAVKANQSETVFMPASDKKVPFKKDVSKQLSFEIESTEKSLFDYFKDLDIFFSEDAMKGRKTGYNNPEFWKSVKELTPPCDATLIIDGCSSESCPGLIKTKESVWCKTEGEKMWLMSEKVQELDKVTCDTATKEWKLENENVAHIEKKETIKCSVTKPATCDEFAITDGCNTTEHTNCTPLIKTAKSVTCKEGNLWLTSTDSRQQMTEVVCDWTTKQWILKNETDTSPETSGTIQCSVKDTTPSTTEPSSTVADPSSSESETDEDNDENKPKDDKDSANCILHIFLVPLAFYSALI